MSKLFQIIRTQYRMHKISSVEVWLYVAIGNITETEAVTICGPKPKNYEAAVDAILRQDVEDGKITQEKYTEITGFPYDY